MKKRLFCFLALPALLMSACTFQEGLSGVKSWIGDHILHPIEDLFNKDKEKEKEKESGQEEGGDTKPEEAHVHSFTKMESNAYEHWGVCECGETSAHVPHNFKLHHHTDMTCKDTSHDEYVCEECEYAKIVNGSEHLEHNYVSRVTKEATCQSAGEITFECTLCGEKITQTFSNEDAHNWVLDSESGGVKNFKCSHEGCDKTKKVIDHSTQTQAAVDTKALKEAGEVQLQNAAIAFDEETLNSFDKNVTIAADAKDNDAVVSELSLDEEVQEKLKDKPIIDFSVTNTQTEEKVSAFTGSVKVTIPYTLKAGENPNGIAIWYLSDVGTESIEASYSNGFVSFETTHFSYYAVVHLSPEEVCEQFGHEMVKGELINSSCYAHGHDDMICRRCGKIERKILPLSQHTYELKDKKDATATSEGYIRYECKVCHDVYDAILPKIATDGRPFYVNLVYSLLSPDFKEYSSTVDDDGVTRYYESYQGLDYEGMPFEYSSSGYGLYKGYQYSSGNEYDRYHYSYSSVNAQLDYYKQFIDALPSIYKEKFNDLVSWVVDKYLVKTETQEGYEFTPNYTEIKSTVDLFVNGSIKDAIKGVIGEETYNKVFDFISENYDKTVSEFLDVLESKGFVFEELYNSICQVLKSNGATEDDIPSIDSILTDDVKNMKLTTFAAFVISQITHADQEAVSQQIPQTYQDFRNLVDEYLDSNLLDVIINIVNMIQNKDSGLTKEYLKDMIKEVTDQLDADHVLMKLKTTKEGGFISLEASVNEFKIPGSNEVEQSAYALITKSYDKNQVLSLLQERAAKCEIKENAFVLDGTHYEWFTKPYEDYFQEKYPGIKFEFVRDFHNEGYDAIVSTQNIQYRHGDTVEEKIEVDEEGHEFVIHETVPVYKEGKLVIKLYNYENYSPWARQNTYGLGDVLAKGEYGITTTTGTFYRGAVVMFETEGGMISEDYYNEYIPSFGILFNLNKQEYHYTDENGSFEYLGESYYKYYNATWEEYEAYQKALYSQYSHSGSGVDKPYPEEEKEHIMPFRMVNMLTGEESYTTRYVDEEEKEGALVTWSYPLSRNMDEEACEHFREFEIRVMLVNGKPTEVVDNSITRPYDLQRYIGYNGFDTEYLDKEFTYQQTRGNTTYRFSSKPTSLACQRNVSWSIVAGGKSVTSNAYKCHMIDYYFLDYVELDRVVVDACHDTVTQGYKCRYCNRTFDEYTYEDEHHDLEYETQEVVDETYSCTYHVHEVTTCSQCDYEQEYEYISHRPESTVHKSEVHEATATRAGYSFEGDFCAECGKYVGGGTNYQFLAPCKHENHHMEGEILVCDDCGYTVKSPNGEVPELIYETFDRRGDDETMTFSVFAPHLDREFEYLRLDEYYTFYLCVGFYDEEGTFKALSNGNRSEIYISWEYFQESSANDYFGWRYYMCNVVEFSEDLYNMLLDQARKENPEQELSVAIAAVAKDSGTIFYYGL